MEKLIERFAQSSDHRDDACSTSMRGETFHSGRSTQQSDRALGPGKDDLFGIFQLWPLESEGVEVDETNIEVLNHPGLLATALNSRRRSIVAVHGLNGDPYKTWMEGDKLWLADFLPLDIPHVRIFTYGYNFGIAFTGCYREERALVMAHERSTQYSSITKDTFGTMFLGTPHRGSDAAFWGKLFGTLADVLTLGSVRTQLLDDLKRKADVLGATCSQFVERSQTLHRIFSVYERVRVKGLSGLVVEDDSAIIVFQDWRDRSDAQILWISGAPGAGKTTASRLLIEHLRRWLQRNQTTVDKEPIVAFYFCTSKQWLRESEEHVVKSLLYQLLSHNKHLFRYLSESDLQSYVSADRDFLGKEDGPREELNITWKILSTILQRGDDFTFWILIDAIDELQDQLRDGLIRRIRLLVLQDLGRKLKFIVCGRSSPLGRGITEPVSWFDIRRQNKVSEDVIKARLDGLRRLSGEARAFYCSLLERIPEDSQEVAKIGFTWVLGSRKPLNVTELQHPVAISTGQKSWSDLQYSLGFNFDAYFDQAFGYLLGVDPNISVRFSHTTVKELLTPANTNIAPSAHDSQVLSKFPIREADVDAELAKRCIIVLSFPDFVKCRNIAREAMAERMRDFFVTSLQGEKALQSLDFAKYDEPDSVHADQETSDRIGKAILKLGQTELDERTHSFLGIVSPTGTIVPTMDLRILKLGPTNACVDYVLHIALKAGIDTTLILRLLADPRAEVNARSKEGWTLLQWCLSRKGLQTVTRGLLRRRDVDTYEQNKQGLNAIEQVFDGGLSEQSALWIIVRSDLPENWFEKSWKLPSRSLWTDPVVDDYTLRTFIHQTASLHWDLMEELIVQRDPFKAVIIDRDGLNLLGRYAYHGTKQRLFRVLDKFPPDVISTSGLWLEPPNPLRPARLWTDWLDKTNCDGRTALHIAAEYRNGTACKALLQAGASCSIRDKTGKLPIHVAAEQGHRAITSLLLKASIRNIGTYAADIEGRSILHYLVMWHSDSFIRQCLPVLRPQVDVRDDTGRSPLHFACIFSNESAPSILLEISVDPNLRDTLFIYASAS
ncbi:hypothetical protein DL766_008254 [Monosporascus sp. MC13-8B]|nr:hypothetical protein DL766_008254 [Monosporascus sp. MC13-8B]